MSKTYRRFPIGCFRDPRGRRQAIINEVRYGAIPPDPWDDVPHSPESLFPWRVTQMMKDKGLTKEVARRKLTRKFHLASWQITYLFKCVYDRNYY